MVWFDSVLNLVQCLVVFNIAAKANMVSFRVSIRFPFVCKKLLELFFGLWEGVIMDDECTFPVNRCDRKAMVNFGEGHHKGLCFGDRVVCSRVHSFGTGCGDMQQNSHWVIEVIIHFSFHFDTIFCFLSLVGKWDKSKSRSFVLWLCHGGVFQCWHFHEFYHRLGYC